MKYACIVNRTLYSVANSRIGAGGQVFGPHEIDENISLSFEMRMKIFSIQTNGNIPVIE
jgi:hypothetical protein